MNYNSIQNIIPWYLFQTPMDVFKQAMEEDKKDGLFPFFVSTTVGTTSCCSADNLREIGPVCEDYECWLHVEAAYAGCAQICPEFRHLFDGIEVSGIYEYNLRGHFNYFLYSLAVN